MHATDSNTLRPGWAPGVPLVRLPDGRVRVGADIERATYIDHCADDLYSWFEQLDGRCSAENQFRIAQSHGLDLEVIVPVLAELIDHDLVVDSTDTDLTLGVIASSGVAIVGGGSIAANLASQLPPEVAVTVAVVDRSGTEVDLELGGAGFAVLVLRNVVPDRTELAIADRLSSLDVPHIVAGVGQSTIRVGPLVTPGRSPCLRCEDLTRADMDPHWAKVSIALTLCANGDVDEITASCAASEIIRDLLLYARLLTLGVSETRDDGVIREARTWGGPWAQRYLQRHPMCGCTWTQYPSAQ